METLVSPMGTTYRYTVNVAGTDLIIETGKLAGQAGAAVMVRVGSRASDTTTAMAVPHRHIACTTPTRIQSAK